MVGNPAGGPGKYMTPVAYIRYGFPMWEEQRAIQFGLWSSDKIEDMGEYYRRWFRFLSQEDMAFHQKFRYVWDEDYI